MNTALISGRRTKCIKCWARPRIILEDDNILRIIWTQIKKGARERNFEFSITKKFAYQLLKKQNYKCALSGLEIKLSTTRADHLSGKTTASLDRKNSNIGYTTENVQWVHKDINKMKNNFDESHFCALCKKIAANN